MGANEEAGGSDEAAEEGCRGALRSSGRKRAARGGDGGEDEVHDAQSHARDARMARRRRPRASGDGAVPDGEVQGDRAGANEEDHAVVGEGCREGEGVDRRETGVEAVVDEREGRGAAPRPPQCRGEGDADPYQHGSARDPTCQSGRDGGRRRRAAGALDPSPCLRAQDEGGAQRWRAS